MSDDFRVVRITDYRPTMPSTEESGENPSSLFGHFPAHLDDFSAAMLRGANFRRLTDSRALTPSTHVTPDEVEKYEQNLKLASSLRGQNHKSSKKPHQGSVMHVVTEGTEHRVNIKF